eukprot:CAMPEP_0202857002 /NCGR_PEP_ID=MMETSP1391-20130828/101_1 /ASSEMBLY_ACC=CAM_ASM_000867 /TAXON_ID=1034604 /ORGANISM="Chlamydomonas leiostraca, Strain SAG 11-49" /LENGTH=133 /DNA_ID=CAMNT_0049535741 /DNA_START=147 /DNA_END=548 /DNA_ORIENTATION=-
MAASNLSWGTEAARLAGLGADLTTKVSTVFAPSDDALAAYATANPGATTMLQSPGGQAAVTAHVVPNSALKSTDIPEGQSTFNTVAGTPLMVMNSGGKLTVSSGATTARVIKSDIMAGNAVIHLIDNVLAPVA